MQSITRPRRNGWDYSESQYGYRMFYVNGIPLYFERIPDAD